MKTLTFTNEFGKPVDWSPWIGQSVPMISGHKDPLTHEELAVLVARKQRECNLVAAVRAMKEAGELSDAKRLAKDVIG